MDTITEVQKFVEAECKKPSSKYGYEPYEFHFVPMVAYAKKLANKLNANKEIVEIAAWLHDIGSIIYGRENHHITSAKVAKEKLQELNYSPEKIEHVCDCILNHRGSRKNNHKTLESQIIAEADALSAFESIGGLFKAAYVYEHLDQGQARASVMKKIENKWRQLHFNESKALARKKYEAFKLLLQD